MSEFIRKLTSKAVNSEGYKNASNTLFSSYVNKMIGEKDELDRTQVKQLLSVAQYLYKVNDSKFRKEGAAILSMLIDVCDKNYPEIIGVATKIFSDAGDFPNIKLIEKNYPDLNFKYSFFSEAEMDFRQELNTVKELNFPLTNFQRTLWENLTSDQDVITVAPTSAGKTHIILSYLTKEMIESDGAFTAIIVPTRALISEVASKLYEIAKEQNFEEKIDICTVPQDKRYADKTFFVMTQERLFDALQSGDISFDYLFIDEAHNITDDSRGVLLHLTIEKVLENSLPQVIVSMPSASYQDSFSTVFQDIKFTKKITDFSPVAKIMMEVKAVGRELELRRLDTNNIVRIQKGFRDKHLSDIVLRFGKGCSNIIYRNQTDHCENIAQNIANKINNFHITSELEEAADYVEEFVHNRFTLASNLRKGVAFHYGPLPSSLRVMIENLVKEDQIKFVACTSTLAEGVNLPAKNLFLFKPMQSKGIDAPERIEDVKLNNITGRAGRMLEHFAGNIFIVEPDEWQVKDYFEDKEEKEEKIPTYFKALNDELDAVMQALDGVFAHDAQDQYKFYTIANKLIKEISEGKIEKTLEAPELSLDLEAKEALLIAVKSAFQSLKVAPFTLEASPTIGYIQQNKLFNFINELEDVQEWILPHPKSPELYNRLVKACKKLVEFGVYTPTGEYLMSYMCVVAVKWIQGDSLKEIITEQIDYMEKNKDNDDQINPNKAVRNVIKVINNDIRFRMANALRCYQLLLSNVIALKQLDLTSTKLHSYIEIGASDDRMMELINMGLSREAAKEVNEKLDKSLKVMSLNGLLKLLSNGELETIHAITKKEVLGLSK